MAGNCLINSFPCPSVNSSMFMSSACFCNKDVVESKVFELLKSVLDKLDEQSVLIKNQSKRISVLESRLNHCDLFEKSSCASSSLLETFSSYDDDFDCKVLDKKLCMQSDQTVLNASEAHSNKNECFTCMNMVDLDAQDDSSGSSALGSLERGTWDRIDMSASCSTDTDSKIGIIEPQERAGTLVEAVRGSSCQLGAVKVDWSALECSLLVPHCSVSHSIPKSSYEWCYNSIDLITAQRQSGAVTTIYYAVLGQSMLDCSEVALGSLELRKLHALFSLLHIREDGVLVAKLLVSSKLRVVVVCPRDMRKEVIRLAHNNYHAGIYKTYKKLQLAWFWPGMMTDIRRFIRCCEVCQNSFRQNKPKTIISDCSTSLLKSCSEQSDNLCACKDSDFPLTDT